MANCKMTNFPMSRKCPPSKISGFLLYFLELMMTVIEVYQLNLTFRILPKIHFKMEDMFRLTTVIKFSFRN